MSAECDTHGTDLLGDQFSGFSCPSCERDDALAREKGLREALEQLVAMAEEFATEADYTVRESTEEEFVDAMASAREALFSTEPDKPENEKQPRGRQP